MPRKPPSFINHPAEYEDVLRKGMFRCICHHVVDGDTADFMIDLGWNNFSYIALRFKGIDAPETRGTSGEVRKKALKAKKTVEGLILNKPCVIKSYKGRSFERYMGEIWFYDGERIYSTLTNSINISENEIGLWVSINQLLLFKELAVPM